MTPVWPAVHGFSLPGGDESHFAEWAVDTEGNVFGLVWHHKSPAGALCGGWVSWQHSLPRNVRDTVPPLHQLVSGGPSRPLRELTISPLIRCRRCRTTGHIEQGRWVDA